MTGVDLNRPLSIAEIDELQSFLDGEALQGKAMDPCMLEGFAAALVIGPHVVMPSQWMAWVWDKDDGEHSPEFESAEQANRIIGLVMRLNNTVARAFMEDPVTFEPMYRRDAIWDARDWCAGFLLGLQFAEEQWLALQREQMGWFTPFVMLGDDEMYAAASGPEAIRRWEASVPAALVQMHAYWRERRGALPTEDYDLDLVPEPFRRPEPKVGRNEPCPCGSGRKFKKCCGTGPTLH
ncbi:UPF0149 family protein [Sinimarinibacterium flocculans]|uniref:UPF0149 family protein n=1 Tax=Sinimarinibacterium flocculans TaxID=985250 RepID=UPI0035172A36